MSKNKTYQEGKERGKQKSRGAAAGQDVVEEKNALKETKCRGAKTRKRNEGQRWEGKKREDGEVSEEKGDKKEERNNDGMTTITKNKKERETATEETEGGKKKKREKRKKREE